MTRREIDRLAGLLELDEDQRALLDTLFVDYRDDFDTVRHQHVAPVVRAKQGLWSVRDGSNAIMPPSAAMIDELFALRIAAVAAIEQLDGAFFADAELAIAIDETQRTLLRRGRDRRTRIVHNRPFDGRQDQGWRTIRGRHETGREATIDISALDLGTQLSEEERRRIDPMLAAYEARLTPSVTQRFDLALDLQRSIDHIRAEHAITAPRQATLAYQELRRRTGRHLEAVEQTIIDLNRATLDRLGETISPSSAAVLSLGYRRLAYPQVYTDSAAVEPLLLKALALDDLTERQRTSLSETLAEYRGAYGEVCERMVAVVSENLVDNGSPEARRAQQDQRRELERLRFERGEINDRARRRLNATLNDHQILRVGLTPAP